MLTDSTMLIPPPGCDNVVAWTIAGGVVVNGTPGCADEKEASTDAKETADNEEAICSGDRLDVGSTFEVMSIDVDDSSGGCDCVVIVVFAKT